MSIYKESIRRFLVAGKAQAIVTRTAELDLTQFYADCASLGATVDLTLFENSLKALPLAARNEGINYLVPGACKEGLVYGFNSDTKSILEFPFSRSSSATYFDKNGKMQIAPPEMPRIDYDPVTGECNGYLLETSQTNFLQNSIPTAAGNSVTEATNWGFPNLMVNGIKLTGGLDHTVRLAYNGYQQNTDYVLSFFIKMADGSVPSCGRSATDDIEPIMYSQSYSPTECTVITKHIGSNVYRISVIRNSKAFGGSTFGIDKRVVNSGKTCIVSGFQLEKATEASSYIETSGAAGIRTGDTLRSKYDIIPYNQGSVFMNMQTLGSGSTSYFAYKGVQARFWYSSTSILSIESYSQSKALSVSPPPSVLKFNKYLLSYSPSVWKTAFNGAAIQSKSSASSWNAEAPLMFGVTIQSQHIRAVAIIPRQLTDAEHMTATA